MAGGRARRGLIGVAFVVLAVGAAGCGAPATLGQAPHQQRSTAADPAGTAAPSPGRALDVPTLPPCRYPSPAELSSLEDDSILVVTAAVPTASAAPVSTVPGIGGYSATVGAVPITQVTVVAQRPGVQLTPSSVLTPWSMPPGEYLLFLTGTQANIPTHGLWGIYRVSGHRLLMSCLTAGNLTQPSPAAGTPPDLASFVAAIPPTLPRAGTPTGTAGTGQAQ